MNAMNAITNIDGQRQAVRSDIHELPTTTPNVKTILVQTTYADGSATVYISTPQGFVLRELEPPRGEEKPDKPSLPGTKV